MKKIHGKRIILFGNILELLPELMKEEEAQIIQSWLEINDKDNKRKQINMKLWDIASNIAEVFDDYILYDLKLLNNG